MTRVINDLMHDRGRGPELIGNRITVYDLIPYLEHPETYSDEKMLEAWPSVNLAQLQALKAYIAEHRDEVMAVHWKIEERHRKGREAQDTPEFRERMRQAHVRIEQFRKWIEDRKRDGTLPPEGQRRAAFKTYLASTEPSGAGVGS
jgi:uncharacterized protein (DUF433 family)